jgi:hypothetical protein
VRSILPEWYEPDDETVERVITTGIITGRLESQESGAGRRESAGQRA